MPDEIFTEYRNIPQNAKESKRNSTHWKEKHCISGEKKTNLKSAYLL